VEVCGQGRLVGAALLGLPAKPIEGRKTPRMGRDIRAHSRAGAQAESLKEIRFIGDKTYKGGNDYEVRIKQSLVRSV